MTHDAHTTAHTVMLVNCSIFISSLDICIVLKEWLIDRLLAPATIATFPGEHLFNQILETGIKKREILFAKSASLNCFGQYIFKVYYIHVTMIQYCLWLLK